MRRRAVFEGLEEKAEALAEFFVAHAEGPENFGLHFLLVDADGA